MRVLWVARAPAPYRYPIWRAVAKEHELRVAFLLPHGVIRDWQIKDEESFDQVLLPAFGPRYREDALWTLRRGWQVQLDAMEAVVLQGAWETPAFWQIKHAARRRRIPLHLRRPHEPPAPAGAPRPPPPPTRRPRRRRPSAGGGPSVGRPSGARRNPAARRKPRGARGGESRGGRAGFE